MVYNSPMRNAAKTTQSRVAFRLPADVKARLQEAAAHEAGGDLSSFLIAAGLERAHRVLAQYEALTLDVSTRERFYAAMREPLPPSETLRRFLTQDSTNFRLLE